MKATVTEIKHPNNHINPRLYVRISGGAIETIDTFRNEQLFDNLKVGQVVEVVRKTNSPFVYIVD